MHTLCNKLDCCMEYASMTDFRFCGGISMKSYWFMTNSSFKDKTLKQQAHEMSISLYPTLIISKVTRSIFYFLFVQKVQIVGSP